MTTRVPADQIEQLVHAHRHPTEHIIRGDYTTLTAYILHSAECQDRYADLRDCPWSLALDRADVWLSTDQPQFVRIRDGRLVATGESTAKTPVVQLSAYITHHERRQVKGALLPTPVADNSRGLPSKGTDFQSLPNAVVSLLPTPRATRGGSSTEIAALLPTCRATDGAKGGPNQRGSKGDLTVPSVIAQRGIDWGKYAAAIDRHAHMLGRPHPPPTITGARGNPKLSAHFTEWMMCAPDGWIGELVDDGTITNNAGLKLCGNGVITPQAVHAIQVMLARADLAGRATA